MSTRYQAHRGRFSSLASDLVGKLVQFVISPYGAVALLIPIMAIFALLQPLFLSSRNLTNILCQLGMLGLVTIGEMFVILTGNFDLSVSANTVFCSVITAFLLNAGFGGPLSAIIVIGLGTGIGLSLGYISVRFKISVLMVTIAAMFSVRGAAYLITGGAAVPAPVEFSVIGLGSFFGIPFLVLILGVCIVAAWLVLNKTHFGRSVYAVGSNPQAAMRCGINKDRTIIAVLGISGFCAGLAGVVLTSRLMSGQPNAIRTYDLAAIAGVVLGGASVAGGRGTVLGTFIGMMIIGSLDNGLNLLRISPYWQHISIGVAIVCAVMMDSVRSRRQLS